MNPQKVMVNKMKESAIKCIACKCMQNILYFPTYTVGSDGIFHGLTLEQTKFESNTQSKCLKLQINMDTCNVHVL